MYVSNSLHVSQDFWALKTLIGKKVVPYYGRVIDEMQFTTRVPLGSSVERVRLEGGQILPPPPPPHTHLTRKTVTVARQQSRAFSESHLKEY